MSILSAALLSRYFDKQTYGTYRQIIYIYNTILVVFTAGLPRVFSYYLPRYSLAEGKAIVNKINKALFVFGLIFSLVLFLSAVTIADALNNPELSDKIKLFSIVPSFLLPTFGIEGIFSTYKNTLNVAIYNSMSRLIMLAAIVLPVIFIENNIIYALYGWVFSSIICFFLALYFKNIPFKKIKSIKTNLSISVILKYSIPLGLASIFGMAISSSDQFFVSRFFGVENFAEFSNGYMELPFVSMITFSVGAVLMPILSKMNYDKTGSIEIVKLWRGTLIKSATIIYPLVVFFICYSEEVMLFMFSDLYKNSSTYFQISLFRNFFNVILFAPLLLSMGKSKIYLNMHILFALIAWLGGYLVTIFLESPYAIAVFASIRSILLTMFSFYIISKLLKIQMRELFPITKLIVIFLHATFSIALTLLINYFMNFNLNELFFLTISFLIFITILLLTSTVFKLLHLEIFKDFINNLKNK